MAIAVCVKLLETKRTPVIGTAPFGPVVQIALPHVTNLCLGRNISRRLGKYGNLLMLRDALPPS
jgi:hypothetical protein